MPKSTDYFIDTGMKREELEGFVKVSDPITWERELVEMGDCVNCKSIDNRVSDFYFNRSIKEVERHSL